MRAKDSPSLKISRWFQVNSKGTLQRIRVNRAMEKQFPMEYRKVYQEKGLVALVNHLRKIDKTLSITSAWNEIKFMFNN